MVAFPLGVEYALNVSIERLHDADPRHHRWVARLGDQDQGFHRCLPFRGLVLGIRKPRDEFAGILKRDDLAAAGKRDWIVEPAWATGFQFTKVGR